MTPERECSHFLTALLTAHGVNEVVVSPGSRNAPLIEAIASTTALKATVVIDERSAAFVALGKASTAQKCVALVCTSGTAMLNYAPALAEARYRNIPLLAITADRPHEWINRNDSQTIIQPGAYANFIKQSFSIDARDTQRYINLTINEAITTAMRFPHGPVHLNIEIPDPALRNQTDDKVTPQIVNCIEPSMTLETDTINALAARLQSPCCVMIVAGCNAPDLKLNRAISRLCSFGNFVTLADAVSNLHGRGIIDCVDTVLSGIDKATLNSLKPDIVISHGGAILSAALKSYLRENAIEHWHVGITDITQDTFGSITNRIETEPSVFYRQLVGAMRRTDAVSDYTSQWLAAAERAVSNARKYIDTAAWSDLVAVTTTVEATPSSYNIQLSNGMSVRYGQILPAKHHRADCNRGVSGIEGSTSTAIGAASCYSGNTLLITGDMSAAYDLNALTLSCKTPRFKMVVICNGGGGIFRYIKGTRGYAEVDRYMVADPGCNIGEIAKTSGFIVFHADSRDSLKSALKPFLAENTAPAMLVVNTNAADSAEVMNNFIHRTKQ